jgi:hypothetical protein
VISENTIRIAKNIGALLVPWIFVRRFIDAVRWVNGGVLSSNGRDEEALRRLRSLPARMREGMSWKVREIQLLSLLQWNAETIEKANAFLLEQANKNDLTPDQRYLICFVQWLGQRAFLEISIDSPTPSLFDYNVSAIDVEQVKPRLKRHFPLRVHPEWKVS